MVSVGGRLKGKRMICQLDMCRTRGEEALVYVLNLHHLQCHGSTQTAMVSGRYVWMGL